MFSPLPDMLILDFSNSTTNKDRMLECQKYTQMGVQLSDLVENIVGKEEIACDKQFFLFPLCFQKLSVVDVFKCVSIE